MESGLTVMSGVSGIFSVGNAAFSVYSSVQNSQRWAALFHRLDVIQKTLDRMEERLDAIYGAVQWNSVVTRLSDPVGRIDSAFKVITDLVEAAQGSDFQLEEHRRKVDQWADWVLHPTEGITSQLQKVDKAMRGLGREFSNDPLMKTFIEQVSSSTQSRYYGAIIHFERWMLIQQKALICLGNAYKYRNPEGKTPTDFVLEDFIDVDALFVKLARGSEASDPLATYLSLKLYVPMRSFNVGPAIASWLNWTASTRKDFIGQAGFMNTLTSAFNEMLLEGSFPDPRWFEKIEMSKELRAALAGPRTESQTLVTNRRILAEAFPNEIVLKRASNADTVKFLERSIRVDHEGRKVSMLEAQAEVGRKYIDRLDRYYTNTAWGDNEGSDFVCFSQEIFAIDTNELVTETGKAVVGLQLYRKGPRIALRILQSPFSRGKVTQANPAAGAEANPNWRESGGDTHQYFVVARKERVTLDEFTGRMGDKLVEELNHYVDMHATEVPDGEVVTGAALYQKSNRIAIKLQSARVQADGTLSESSRRWTESPGWGNNDPADFVELKIMPRKGQSAGSFRGVSIHKVEPDPLAPIRGAKLLMQQGSNSNRIAIAVSPGLNNSGDLWKTVDVNNLGDLWRKYDVGALAQTPVLPAASSQVVSATTR